MAKKVKKAAKKAVKKTSAKKVVKKSAAKKTPAKKVAKKKTARKVSPVMLILLTPSAVLSTVIGSKPLPRPHIIKKIWEYIKKNKLQDKKNRRMINADEKLKPFFGGKNQVSMFDLAKFINKHAK
jgi:upstream activation factor subunit UAF30